MKAPSNIYTLKKADKILGVSEKNLLQMVDAWAPEDGLVWVHDHHSQYGCWGVTDLGMQNLTESLKENY